MGGVTCRVKNLLETTQLKGKIENPSIWTRILFYIFSFIVFENSLVIGRCVYHQRQSFHLRYPKIVGSSIGFVILSTVYLFIKTYSMAIILCSMNLQKLCYLRDICFVRDDKIFNAAIAIQL